MHGVREPIRITSSVAVFSGYLYELLAMLTSRPPVTTAAWVRVGSQYSFWDSSKAVEELGMPQTPIHTAIEESVRSLKEYGHI